VSTPSAALPGTAALLQVRRPTESDRQPLVRMLARCTAETRYRRFHGQVTVFPERYLTEALAGGPVHFAVVASAPAEAAGPAGGGRAVVALASCRVVAEGIAELGVLVEDEWQRHGVGGRLLAEILGFAARTGLRALQAQVLAEQSWIVRLLRRHGRCETVASGDLLTVTVRLPRPAVPLPA
jgi:GNAT superfamily N-acetyltransferase